MSERATSTCLQRALIVAAACYLPLVSLTACSLPIWSQQPAATNPQEEARQAQRPWVSAEYIDWLERRSMLGQSRRLTPLVSGQAMQWRHAYASPQPRAVVQKASVWSWVIPDRSSRVPTSR
jgi:hypothetical protein